MRENLHRFFRAARGAGVRLSPAESIDAMRAVSRVGFIHEVRTLDLKKLPSVSETIDWARVLVLLQAPELGHEIVKDTLNVLLKYEADIEATLPQVSSFISKASRQNVFG